MQLLRRDREPLGRAADLAQADQVRPAVEGGVLDALGHHGTAGLLEADHQLVAAGLAGAPRGPGLLAEEQLGEQVQGLVPVGRQAPARHVDGLGERGSRLGARGSAGHHVVPVAVGCHEQLDEAVLQRAPGVVAQSDVVAADRRGELGEPVHLGVQGATHHLALGRLDEFWQCVAGVPGELVQQRRERRRSRPGR